MMSQKRNGLLSKVLIFLKYKNKPHQTQKAGLVIQVNKINFNKIKYIHNKTLIL